MLTSSDAKWRCLWHMFVWSILLTLVSQFLQIDEHITFYIIAGLSVLGLPVLTAVYSNTAGKRGASLLRVGYVICDPVLACITITPIQLFNNLPQVIQDIVCLSKHSDANATMWCLDNSSALIEKISDTTYDREMLIKTQKGELLVIQACIVTPSLIGVLMGPRTHKMKLTTFFVCFLVWLVSCIEAVDLIEYALVSNQYQHNIYTTQTTISIVTIVTHSYAVVTLCSYISPVNTEDNKKYGFSKKFDFLYQSFLVIAGVLFTELPLIISRMRIMSTDFNIILPAAFYSWLIKDIVFLFMLSALLVIRKIGHRKVAKFPCSLNLDTTNVIFQPEKRDEYIVKKRVRFQEPLFTTRDEVNNKSSAAVDNNRESVVQSEEAVSSETERLHDGECKDSVKLESHSNGAPIVIGVKDNCTPNLSSRRDIVDISMVRPITLVGNGVVQSQSKFAQGLTSHTRDKKLLVR